MPNNDPRGRDKRKRPQLNSYRDSGPSGGQPNGAVHPMAARGRLVLSPATGPVKGSPHQWAPPRGHQPRHPSNNNFLPRQLNNTIWQPNNQSRQQPLNSPRHPNNQSMRSSFSPRQSNDTPRQSNNTPRQGNNTPRRANSTPRQANNTPRHPNNTPKQANNESRHSNNAQTDSPLRKKTSRPNTPNGRNTATPPSKNAGKGPQSSATPPPKSAGKGSQSSATAPSKSAGKGSQSSEIEVIKVVKGESAGFCIDRKGDGSEVAVLDEVEESPEQPAKKRRLGDSGAASTSQATSSSVQSSEGGPSEGAAKEILSSEEEEGEEKDDDDDEGSVVAVSWKQWTPPAGYVDHLTEALDHHYAANKQRDHYFGKKVMLRDAIQKIVLSNFGEGVLHLTGSSMSGFGTKDSDADMALVFDPYVSVVPKSKARKVIHRLAGSLRREAFCSNVETIFAKVPIIKLYDNISGCDVDININNLIGIKNSFLLRSISSLDERISVFVIALKLWAKSWNINSAYLGTMSSYTLVNMALYFFQIGLSPPLLPALKPYVDKLQGVNVNSQLQNYRPGDFIKFTIKNTEPVGAIWVKFFYFWNKRFKQKKIFSVYSAKERLRNYNEHGLDTPSYAFVIEEPFQKDNIARSVQFNQFEEIKLRFSEMCRQMQGTVPFERLFGEPEREERHGYGRGR